VVCVTVNVSEKRRSLPEWEGWEHSTLVECYTITTTRVSEKFTTESMPRPSPVRQHDFVVSITLRRGIFPGSFNPLTVAHLEIARQAAKEQDLDIVVLVVSAVALDKPSPPGPPLDERIRLIDADLADIEWLHVERTDKQLIADIAEGYDVVIMGADKWHQVNDVRYYESAEARDVAIGQLPTVVVAQREGSVAPAEHMMATPEELHGISSSDARDGRRDLMAPHAADHWHDHTSEPDPSA
jgi:cytidyltransferase-like protein